MMEILIRRHNVNKRAVFSLLCSLPFQLLFGRGIAPSPFHIIAGVANQLIQFIDSADKCLFNTVAFEEIMRFF